VAQRMQVIFEDDIDGSEAAGTVTFGLSGVQYEVDLSKKNSDKLAEAFAPYIEAGRKVSSRSPRPGQKPSRSSGPDPQEVRAWAKSAGIEVKDKGRVPAELIVRFQAAGQ
jgi:hypothetical protein